MEYGFSTEGNEVVANFPSQVDGKIFLITGPSQGGIGAETAMSLARGSPKMIILLGRSISKIQSTIDTIRSISPTVLVKYIQVDLDSLRSVRTAAAQIMDDTSIPNIDVIINNAAIMACPYQRTVDGYESQFATNHLSHFLLTNLLMTKLQASAAPRVVNLSSLAHLRSNVRFGDIDFQDGKTYAEFEAYAQAKTANILFSVGLNERGLTSFAVHPGSIASGLQKYATPEMYKDALGWFEAEGRVVKREMKSLQQGCASTLRAALDPDLRAERGEGKTNCYLVDCAIVTGDENVRDFAVDEGNARQLWALSEEMVGEKFA